MKIIFFSVIIVWVSTEIAYKKVFQSGEKDIKKDNGTLNVLWYLIMMALFFGISTSYYTSYPIFVSIFWEVFSLLLIILGIIGRYLSIKSLGKNFKVDVSFQENHQLKKDGLYKNIRHPSYTFALLSFLGLGIYLNDFLSLFFVFVPVLIGFLYRIKIEEKAMLEYFGEEYRLYQSSTKKLIPFIY